MQPKPVSTEQYPYTWEQAIEILRRDPQHQQLIHDSYLTADLLENCHRFYASDEFNEVLNLVKTYAPGARRVLDLPAGNGIATYALNQAGFEVVAVEPDPSPTLGRGAIEHIIAQERLQNVRIVDAFGEALPFNEGTFDFAYIRQGLHHAHDLQRLIAEVTRILKPNGLMIASREPVVDDYEGGLREFLDTQPDHQLYGGEHAFTHDDYLHALQQPGLRLIANLGPYDSIVNLYPNSFSELRRELLNSRTGRVLTTVLPQQLVYRFQLMVWRRRNREQGRLYTFIARKES